MVQIIAQATREVNIPNRQQTQGGIISLFQAQMHSLKERLKVRDICSINLLQPKHLVYLEQVSIWQNQSDLRCMAG